MVQGAHEILVAAPATSVEAMGRELGVSARHLSRIFREHTGETISRCRNEIRVRQALDAIANGAPSLTRLAADLGFADHAHLSRTVRRLTGRSPSDHRAALAPRSGVHPCVACCAA
jgi:transcriptional regulator GlxA family with amidase domain